MKMSRIRKEVPLQTGVSGKGKCLFCQQVVPWNKLLNINVLIPETDKNEHASGRQWDG